MEYEGILDSLEHSVNADAMSQTWSYTDSHVKVDAMSQTWSYTSSHLIVDAMSQTWSYTSAHIELMPCPRHDLTLALLYLCRCHVPNMVLH
ncbi:hypothetical protein J1N35_011640 [Gossypium stocksii]|uniref:Uncharacterized protein n=1 Tax=Gossypium stocksii TaxID=47602 RepID=A0A9D3W369_9ROSI|nr:hypothetical protein J1N35_011640 [Gossypium stocksii]